jgi:DnaJ-class molecular chaperone
LPEYVECPECHGSGLDEALSEATGEDEPCTFCTGEGMVDVALLPRDA